MLLIVKLCIVTLAHREKGLFLFFFLPFLLHIAARHFIFQAEALKRCSRKDRYNMFEVRHSR